MSINIQKGGAIGTTDQTGSKTVNSCELVIHSLFLFDESQALAQT